MQPTRLFLIRHGQVVGHEEKRYNGQVNVPLTELGRAQSTRICSHLSGVALAAVYASDLDRSRHCAALIAARHGLAMVQERALRELHVGDWEGRTWAELQAAYPRDWQARIRDLVNYRVPGGECLQDAADRIRPVLRQIIQRHAGDNVALVAHGGVNRIVLLDAIGAPLEQAFAIEQDYGCINIIDYHSGERSLVRLLNSTAHLDT